MLGLPLRSSNPDLADKKYIAAMFASGEQGVWYDPSDLSTMYQDAAGTIPVTAVGQPVGLILDKSKGAIRGPELLNANLLYSGTLNSGWSYQNLTFTAASVVPNYSYPTNSGGVQLPIPGVALNKFYEVRFSIAATSGNVGIAIGDSNVVGTFGFRGSGSYRIISRITGRLGIVVQVGSGFSGSITIESVREVLGNHATQSTAASRPTLSARVNLLTKTEQFDDAVWQGARATITANNTIAPNGTQTADRITETVDNGTHRTFQSFKFQPSTTYSASFCWKKGTRRWVWITFQTDSFPATQLAQFFDLDNGVLGSNNTGAGGTQASRVSASITSLGDGWYRCSLAVKFGSEVTAGSFTGVFTGLSSADNVNLYVGTPNDYNWVWGADLRVANESPLIPAYQRVNTDTDYDTAGFPYYLLFDGVDDWMVTPSIDFSSTDKMTVFAGVRKLSDAAGAFVAELSVSRGLNAGAWSLIAPGGIGVRQGYYFSSKGTLDSSNGVDSGFAPPITNVLTGIGDISGDLATLRVNGTQAASRTADQGTGNYGNYPLYIGRRGGTELPFKGHLYGLIVRGAATDDNHLTHAEKYLAYKSGVSL